MVASSFEAAYKRVRVYEGGNVDDPHDPGGRTSRGVTQRVYDAYRRRQGSPPRDVWKASEPEIKEIYRAQYWDAVNGDALPAGIDLVVYDGGVNSGPKQSIKWLQAALNAKRTSGNVPVLSVDGVLGQVTLDALDANMDNDLLVGEIEARRLGFLKSLSTWKRYGKGWSARVGNLLKAGQALATGSVGPKPVEVAADGGHMKAPPEAVKASFVDVTTGATSTAASAALAGASDAVNGAAGQIQTLAEFSDTLRIVFVGLTIVGVGITLYAAWRAHFSNRAISGDARADVVAGASEAVA